MPMRHLTLAAVALTAALLGACDPSVARIDGGLRVDVEGLPLEVDALVVILRRAPHETQLLAGAEAGRGSVLVQAVPVGEVDLEVIANRGAREVARRSSSAVVVAGVETRVVVSFGVDVDGGVSDGGGAEPYEAPVTWMVGGVTDADVSGGGDRLTVDFAASNGAFAAYLTQARAHLGRDPTGFEVVDAVVTAPVVSGVADLRGLFTSVTASIESAGGGTSVVLGTGTPTAAGATLVVESSHTAGLQALLADLLANTFTLRLRGDFPGDPVPPFAADLAATLTVRAR